MTSRFVFSTSLALVLLTSSVPAAAAGTAEASAVKLFEQGRLAFEKKSYSDALAAFESSLALIQSPNTRIYIGRCLRELGRTASARTAFLRAAAEAHDAVANGEARYKGAEDSGNKEAAALAAKVPHLVIAIPATANQPTVSIDGTALPNATGEQTLDVDPGPHSVKATAAHSEPFEASVDVAPAATTRVDVTFKRVPVGIVHLALPDRPNGYAISLDGKPLEPSAVDRPIELPPGPHSIVVAAPGRTTFTWSAPLNDGDDVTVNAALTADAGAEPTSSKAFPRWPVYVAGGVGVVALGVATGLAVSAKGTSDDEQAKPINQRTADQRDHISSQSHVANALFIGGGVVLVGAAVLGYFAFRKPEEPKSTAVRISPWASPNGGGVFAGGHF